MASSNRILMSYLALLAIVTSGIQCLNINKLSATSSSLSSMEMCETIPEGCVYLHMIYGKGVETDYQPYAELCETDEYVGDEATYVSVYTNDNRKCNFTFEADYPVTKSIYQVSADRLLLFSELAQRTNITMVDMSTCESKDIGQNINKSSPGDWHFLQYADGFAEIITSNDTGSRITYDLNGNQIGLPEAFVFKYKLDSLRPISPKSHASNLIAEYKNDSKQYISLLDARGQLIKPLLVFDENDHRSSETDFSDSVFTYCWKELAQYYSEPDKTGLHCAQFDEFGREKYRNSTNTNDILLSVRHFKDGGLMLFTYSPKQIHAFEMRPGRVHEKIFPWTSIDFSYQKSVLNSNEADRQFTIVTYVNRDSAHKNCWHSFSFPSQKNGPSS